MSDFLQDVIPLTGASAIFNIASVSSNLGLPETLAKQWFHLVVLPSLDTCDVFPPEISTYQSSCFVEYYEASAAEAAAGHLSGEGHLSLSGDTKKGHFLCGESTWFNDFV